MSLVDTAESWLAAHHQDLIEFLMQIVIVMVEPWQHILLVAVVVVSILIFLPTTSNLVPVSDYL